MTSRILRRTATITLFATLVLRAGLTAQEQKKEALHYIITDIGTLGGTFSEAVGISNRGAVSGYSTLPGDSVIHGFFWHNGVMSDLGTLGGPNSFAPEAWAPNARNEVAGFSDTSALDPNNENFCGLFSFLPTDPYICLPFVWRRGLKTPLPTLGGNNAAALAINNRGQLVGVSETSTATDCVPHYDAVVWEPKGAIRELPPLPGDTEAVTAGINDKGEVVGSSGNCALGGIEAVLWRNGTPINLGTLGGKVFNGAFGINNRSQVVGQSNLPGDTIHHAFLWQNGVMADLGSILDLPVSLAPSINDRGQVVGFSQDVNGDFSSTVAWIWQDGEMTDLNTLISDPEWFLVEALGINDRGQIVGYALNNTTGEVHGFLATPCDQESVRGNGCERGDAFVDQSETRQRRDATVPEIVRDLLQKQLQNRWYRAKRGMAQ